MSDEVEDSYYLHAFIGERDPIRRLAGYLKGASVVALCQGVYMMPFPESVRKAAHVGDNDYRPGWPFSGIDAVSAQRLSKAAGVGRIAYLELWGYKDAGHEFGIGWRDGCIHLGPVDEKLVERARGVTDQMAHFLGLDLRGRDAFGVLGLGRYKRTEEWSTLEARVACIVQGVWAHIARSMVGASRRLHRSPVARIPVCERGGTIVLDMHGSDGWDTWQPLDDQLSELLTAGNKAVAIDFGGQGRIQAQELATLIRVLAKSRAAGARVALLRPSEQMRKALVATGVGGTVAIYDDEEEALASFRTIDSS